MHIHALLVWSIQWVISVVCRIIVRSYCNVSLFGLICCSLRDFVCLSVQSGLSEPDNVANRVGSPSSSDAESGKFHKDLVSCIYLKSLL